MLNRKAPSLLRVKTSAFYCLINFKKTSSFSVSNSLSYCMDLVRKLDRENYLCTLFLPKGVRDTAFAIRAFNIELSKIQERINEKHAGVLRGSFWETDIDQIYKENPPNHPVSLELFKATKRHRLSKFHFKKLLNSRLSQLNVSTFKDFTDMENYADQTCTPVLMLLLEAMNISDLNCDHVASHIGKAQGLCNLMRSLPYNFKENVILLPRSELLEHKVSEESLIRNTVNPEALSQIIFKIATKANTHLKLAGSLRSKIPLSSLSVFLPAVPVKMFLDKLEETNFYIYDTRLWVKSGLLPFYLYWNKLRKTY